MPWGDDLVAARRELQRGEVDAARRRLKAVLQAATIARGRLELGDAEWIEWCRRALDLVALYEWFDLGETLLALAREATSDARSLALLDALEARLELAAWKLDPPPSPREPLEFARSTGGPSPPWLVNFHLATCLLRGDVEGFDATLTWASRHAPARAPLDRAVQLVLLADRHARCGLETDALTILDSLERRCAAANDDDRTVELAYQRAVGLVQTAHLEARRGRGDAALRHLESAGAIGLRWGLRRIGELTRLARGLVLEALGLSRDAIDALSRPQEPIACRHIEVLGRLAAAWTAARSGRPRLAARLASRARPPGEVDDLDDRTAAFARLVEGEISLARGASYHRRARDAFDRAEKHLETRNRSTDIDLRSMIALGRGWLELAERRVDAAVAQSFEALTLARQENRCDLEAHGLLLQSTLLLEPGPSRSRLYDRVLSRLGVVREPELLLRVVSNLYLYMYERADDLDLLDLHLKQILSLEERLGPDRFQRLYRHHVVEPLLSRLGRNLRGDR